VKDTLIIVTGASKGIGAGIVKSFIDSTQYQIVGLSRSSSKFNPRSERYREILGDLTTDEPLKQLKELIALRKPQQICLVHNYGFTHNSNLLELTTEDWDKTFNANVKLPFIYTREISPLMPAGSSHVYIGSTLSQIAVPDSAAYIASKHAILGLMRAAAIDLAPKSIRTNLVCPGFTESDMAREVIKYTAAKSNMTAEEYWKLIESKSPLKRFLKPEEIGNFVVYLANNPTISGEVIHINGGFNLV
jgi:3-oxoacyl-[acyl-carrier protein] reductase